MSSPAHFGFTRKQMFRIAAVFPAASVHHLAAGRIMGVGPDSLKSGPIALRQPAGPLLRVFPFCPDIVRELVASCMAA